MEGNRVYEVLLVIITVRSFVSVVISENTKINSYFSKIENSKLFVSISKYFYLDKFPRKAGGFTNRSYLKPKPP